MWRINIPIKSTFKGNCKKVCKVYYVIWITNINLLFLLQLLTIIVLYFCVIYLNQIYV